MDCAVIPSKYPDIFTVQTTDFFYPLVDDPYIQGKIGCANVLSDLYAMGIVDCDSMLMLLAASTQMEKQEQTIVTREMMKGFNDLAIEAGTRVTGGQSVQNPWPIIGGVATTICKKSDFIMPENIVEGDVLVLTKPLGTQVAVNVHQWLSTGNYWDAVKDSISEDEAERAYEIAMESMSRLNRNGARLMQKYGAHGATDITGFGIMGHAANLAKNQKVAVHFEIHTLPIIRSMKIVDEKVQIFSLLKGYSSETSGGLFIGLPAHKAQAFCDELQQLDGHPSWIVGRVVKSDHADPAMNQARIIDNPTILEI
jgi:selenide,water dikinase